MKKNNRFLLIFALIIFTIMSCNTPVRPLETGNLVAGFELLPSEQTGIDFNNKITESTYLNHYYFRHIYIGAGVAIGDINNDGLADIFFGGNQVSDKLYLNKGNFNFEDITKTSKTAIHSGWTWGVTMADVNGDGYLDIYVSRNGNSLKLEDRKNLLYINNQDLTFTESAVKYGLADVGFSTQAAFFDMDNDGDLDMYQLNQPPDHKLFLTNKIPQSTYKYYRDRLYRNEGGRFVDVSDNANISKELAYGLSITTSDFNNDGFVDMYVSNDYNEPDILYYNNGNGTFNNVTTDYIKHMSQYSMGSDAGDINNDGLVDLFTTDMTPDDHYRSKMNMASMSSETFHNLVEKTKSYQYMTNTLQVNTGYGFSDVANVSGLSNTDWTWASLIADMDNDGFKDILVTNGIKKDVENNDYNNFIRGIDANTTVDELFEYSKNTPSKPISNYIFKNNGNLKFDKVAKEWGFDTPSFSNGMAYGDLDNDGDLDIVTNNMDAKAFVYKNNASGNFLKVKLNGDKLNKFGIGAKAKIYYGDKVQLVENSLTRGFLSSVEPGLFFGLGTQTKVDKVEVIWPDGKMNSYADIAANQTIKANYSSAKAVKAKNVIASKVFAQVNAASLGINYKHEENNYDDFAEEILLPHRLSTNGPFSAVADVNDDGLDDVFLGGAAKQSGILYIQQQSGKFIPSTSQPWERDKASEDLEALFFDADNDGDKDLYVTSGGNEYKQGNSLLNDRLYINDGKGNYTKSINALPKSYESTQCVKASDIDGDGDLDLFVGTRLISGKYPYPGDSYFLINTNGVFQKLNTQSASALKGIGMVTDAVFSDIDNDGDNDMIVVGEWMNITILQNNDGVYVNKTEAYGLSNSRGLWWSITASDIDNDGDDDYIIGNLGKNNKFKASEAHPFKVYANDFDNNGVNDIVLAKFYKDDYVPVRGRECTSQQMPYVAEKFKDYHSFASSKLLDILPENKLEKAIVYEISNFESIILINDNGKLIKKPLPIEAQISPVKSSIVSDFDNDGFKDVLLLGNHYGVEVETVRYDAGYGLLLKGSGDINNLKPISANKSGFYIPSDARDIQALKVNNLEFWLVTNNDATVSVYKKG